MLESVWRNGGPGPLLAKTIYRNYAGEVQVGDYADATWFLHHPMSFASIEDLARLLPALSAEPRKTIVRGAPVPGLDLTRPQLRRLRPRGEGPRDASRRAPGVAGARYRRRGGGRGHRLAGGAERCAGGAAGTRPAARVPGRRLRGVVDRQPRLQTWRALSAVPAGRPAR